MKSLDTLAKLWKSITLDFVVKLLLSEDLVIGILYDSILNVVNRTTKYTILILYYEASDTQTLGHIFIKEVVSIHRVPNEIISD